MKAKEEREAQETGKKSKWVVERGSARVKIYRTPHGDSDYFTISYWLDGKRKRQVFPTLQKARDEAGAIATQLTKGDLGAAELTSADRAAYHRATTLLQPSGAPLEFAAAEYANAIQRLGAVSLTQAVDFYLKRHPVHLAPKTVREVADELLKLKEADQLSLRYRKQLEYDLNRFAGRFRARIGDVAGTEIDGWLRELEVGPRTRNNLRNSIQSLVKFAISRKYLPKDHDELDAVPVAKDGDGEIEIFTPGEMTELLVVATPAQIPFLAISAFAGVRHAELQRLDWSQVKRGQGVIEIRAGTAKTASRRVIPILPNLSRWLAGHWQESGEVCPYANMVMQFVELTRRVNERRVERAASAGMEPVEFEWKHNALRHSFISYRVAQTQNVAQVALEAGNSPNMIFKHYRELVTEADAGKWFAIKPAKRAKVIALASQAGQAKAA